MARNPDSTSQTDTFSIRIWGFFVVKSQIEKQKTLKSNPAKLSPARCVRGSFVRVGNKTEAANLGFPSLWLPTSQEGQLFPVRQGFGQK